MSASIEIFSKVRDYLERRITLQGLESWLVPKLPLYLANPDSDVGRLVGLIELRLAELKAGIRTERSVRLSLRRHAGREPVFWMQYPARTSEDMTTSSTPVSQATTLGAPVRSPLWSTGAQVVNA